MTLETGYGYAVSRLRAMELRILGKSLFQRLLESDDFKDAIKTLGETHYAKWLSDDKGTQNFEYAISMELQEAYDTNFKNGEKRRQQSIDTLSTGKRLQQKDKPELSGVLRHDPCSCFSSDANTDC